MKEKMKAVKLTEDQAVVFRRLMGATTDVAFFPSNMSDKEVQLHISKFIGDLWQKWTPMTEAENKEWDKEIDDKGVHPHVLEVEDKTTEKEYNEMLKEVKRNTRWHL